MYSYTSFSICLSNLRVHVSVSVAGNFGINVYTAFSRISCSWHYIKLSCPIDNVIFRALAVMVE